MIISNLSISQSLKQFQDNTHFCSVVVFIIYFVIVLVHQVERMIWFENKFIIDFIIVAIFKE
jgi:hypothetical protein